MKVTRFLFLFLAAPLALSAQEILEATERAANLTRQLLAFGRKQVMQPKKLNINQRFRETLSRLKRIVGEDIAIVLDLGSTDLHAFADSVMFDQMIMNLVVNSRDAMEIGRGEIRISTGRMDYEEGADHIFVEVSDNGSGIPQDALDLIFDPFFTTKEQGRGTGLGLATVFGIVEQHKGKILVDSHVGKGTSFRILLPKLDCEKNESDERETVRDSAGCSGTILLAEDESSVRKLIQIILTREGYQVIEAENGGEAVEIWNQEKDQIDLLLTDIVMPGGLNGFELASQLRDEAPDLNVAFMSGYSADVAGKELNLEAGQIFIQKPASREELLSSVRESLGNPTSQVGLAN
ncbi:ATP-binding protein [bacterium]|nr:ATP-binding protein [bacterium]